MDRLKIVKLQFYDNYQMELLLSNGRRIEYDMADRMQTVRFVEIADPDRFRQGKLIGDNIIHWSDTVEITLAEILFQVMDPICSRDRIVPKEITYGTDFRQIHQKDLI